MSLLSWERGLKFVTVFTAVHSKAVAPLVGAWIEIYKKRTGRSNAEIVAPLVGAWIEISTFVQRGNAFLSLLSWERGLKSISPSTTRL